MSRSHQTDMRCGRFHRLVPPFLRQFVRRLFIYPPAAFSYLANSLLGINRSAIGSEAANSGRSDLARAPTRHETDQLKCHFSINNLINDP